MLQLLLSEISPRRERQQELLGISSIRGDDTNFTLQATAATGAGTLIPNLGAAVVSTSAGDDNQALDFNR